MRKRNRIVQLLLFAVFVMMAAGCSKEGAKAPNFLAEISEAPKDSEFPTAASKPQKDPDFSAAASETESSNYAEAEHIAELCRELYEKAAQTNTSGSLEVMGRIVERLGGQGYAAVDSKNQVDMINAKQVLEFCEAAEKQEPAELTILVAEDCGLRKFDIKTEDGSINIVREYCQYDENGSLKNIDTASYPADRWQLTKEGYLIFEGKYFSAVNYVLTLSDTPEHTVLRILPLDEACREWNRKYILPVGYGRNNIFLSDWSEEDFEALELYDVFDVFYPELYQKPVPYAADENLNAGAVYQVPEHEFEAVISAHFKIDRETIRAKTAYVPKDRVYEYRPRGFYEVDYSDIPYPEVVSGTKNPDGTITLFVNGVYPDGKTSRLFSHKTVIRPLKEGESKGGGEEAFEYVSNQVIVSSEPDKAEGISARGEHSFWWHAERLSWEQWMEIYGGKE